MKMPKMKSEFKDKLIQLSNNTLSRINNKYYFIPNNAKGHCSKCGVDIIYPETISTKILCNKCGSTKIEFGQPFKELTIDENYKVETKDEPVNVSGEPFDPKKLKNLKDDCKRFTNDDVLTFDNDELIKNINKAKEFDDDTLKVAYDVYRQSEFHDDKALSEKGQKESIYALYKEMERRGISTNVKQTQIKIDQPITDKKKVSIEPSKAEIKSIEDEIDKKLNPEKQVMDKAKDLQYKVSQVDEKLKEADKKKKMSPRVKQLWIDHVDTFGRLIGNIEIKLITKIKRHFEKTKNDEMQKAIEKKYGAKYDSDKHKIEKIKPWRCPDEVSCYLIEAWSLLIDTYLDMGLDEFLEKLPYLLLVIAHINLFLSMMDE